MDDITKAKQKITAELANRVNGMSAVQLSMLSMGELAAASLALQQGAPAAENAPPAPAEASTTASAAK